MAANRWTLVPALALAVVSATAHGQAASVSLTHTVSVTVPPRVKVQLASPTKEHAVSIAATGGSALAISVSATQSWALSIAPRGRSSLQWSTDRHAGFSELAQRGATVARGNLSQSAAISTLFLRDKQTVGGSEGMGEGEAVVLTMVAP